MAEEFKSLPQFLQKISSTLIDNRKSRTAVICGVIVLMSLTSSVTLIDIEGHNPADVSRQHLESSTSTLKNVNFSETSGNPSPIILNLSLRTNINNNITVNVHNENRTQCGDKCLRDLIGNFDDIVSDAQNITKLANQTSSILQDLNKKLSDLKHGKLKPVGQMSTSIFKDDNISRY